jgi:hypothetical protein
MHTGTIEWNGSDLSRIGKPKLTIKRQADPPSPGLATRMLVTLTVTVDLEAQDPGTITARAEWLAESMRVSEGILRSTSGSGHTLEWLAAPGDTNLSAALLGRTNAVELNFTATENHAAGGIETLARAEFTPAGSTLALVLHAVRDVKEEIKTARHAERNGARTATTTTLVFTARAAQSNPAEPIAARLAYLQAQLEAVKALDAREGVMVFGLFNRIVRVTELSPVIDERRGVLDVQVQCYCITLPDAGTAEVVLEFDTRQDEGTGEEVVSLKGEIAAETRAIALAKLEVIRSAQAALPDQRIASYQTQTKFIDGADTAAGGDDWTGALNFTLEIRKGLPGGHKTLRIATQRDIRSGMRWTYSGSVKAQTEAAALAAARAIAASAGHPLMTRSEETLDKASQITAPEVLLCIKLDFNYEFEGPSDGFIGGELSWDVTTPLAGEWRRAVSGFLVAVTPAAAEARLVLLLAAEGIGLEVSRKWSEVYHDVTGGDAIPQRMVAKLDFTHATRTRRTRASVEFTDAAENDIGTMRQTRTVSGTLWSDTEAHANAALTTFGALLFGPGGAQKTSRNHTKLQYAAAGVVGSVTGSSQWIKLDFSMGSTTALTGVTGYDLMEATFSMERTGSINAAIITPIPFARPVAQAGTGWIPGRIAITANAKAISLATARNWVQGKRAMVGSIGALGITRFETEQPRETCAPDFAPFTGTNATLWTFNGSYGWTFIGAGVADGLWTTGLPG